MITKERLEELIKQGATVYENKEGHISEIKFDNIDMAFGYKVSSIYLIFGMLNLIITVKLENLFETKEEAEWYLEFGNIQRTETLKMPTWKEFCERKYVSFSDEFCNHYELELSKYSMLSITKYPCDWVIYEKPLTKENYIEACRLAKKLFLGEGE